MKKLLIALILASPVVAMAIDTWDPQKSMQNAQMEAGREAVSNKNWQAAVDSLSLAVKADPRNADAHNLLGYSYRNMDKMQLSFKHYNEALRLEPNHRGANEYIGWAYLKTGKLAQAEGQLARLEKICGTSCEEYVKLSKGVADYKAKNKS